MARRGRPRMNGAQPGWMLARMLLVLRGYDRSRSTGHKHFVAVSHAVTAVRSLVPDMPISETEVKRTLANLRSKSAQRAWTLKMTKLPSADVAQVEAIHREMWPAAEQVPKAWKTAPRGWEIPPKDWKIRSVFAIGFGPRPQYPRSNARTIKILPLPSANNR
jgi:hypothetical protein